MTYRYGKVLDHATGKQAVVVDGEPAGWVYPKRDGWGAGTPQGRFSGLTFPSRKRAAQWCERWAGLVRG